MSRKKNKKNRKQRKPSLTGPVFTQIKNPFTGIPRDVLMEGLVEASQSSSEKFKKTYEELKLLIQSCDSLHLLSVFAVYGLFVGLTETGKTAKKGKENSILQPHVELIQALALQIPPDKQSFEPATPDKIQKIWDLSIDLNHLFTLKRLGLISKAETFEEKAVLELQERLRNHTHMVRNWGYFQRVIDITKRLYAPLDLLYENEIGIGATALIQIFEHLVMRMEEKINSRRDKLIDFLRSPTTNEAVRAYYHAFPKLESSPEELIGFFNKNEIPLEGVKSILLSHSDLNLSDDLTFTCTDLSRETGINFEDLSRALSKLGYCFGDLKDEDSEYFFLGNPIWLKPLIRLSDDVYFCSIPQVFFSFILQILDGLLANNDKTSGACSRRRAEFLEDEVEKLITDAFPNSLCVRNLKWHELDAEYENDLLIKIDSYLLLIEAKSGAVSQPALRGAPDRLKYHIKELLINPATQSMRLAEKLWNIKLGKNIDSELTHRLPFHLDTIQKIVRLSVTLEDFATIQSNIVKLKKTGWLKEDLSAVPTMTLADLQIVFDILMTVPEKLHYLIRRSELEENMSYVGDELDLLSLYLDTGFNLGEAEFTETFSIIGMSKKIDNYYIPQDHGFLQKKPVLKSTTRWRDIRYQIEKRNFDRWSEAAIMLLNVSFDEQQTLEKMLRKVVKNVKKNWSNNAHLNSVILSPPKWRYDAFGFIAYRQKKREKRYDLMRDITSKIFSESHANRCLLIGLNIDSDDYPYSILGVFDRLAEMN